MPPGAYCRLLSLTHHPRLRTNTHISFMFSNGIYHSRFLSFNVCQVLTLEGGLEDSPYILPVPDNKDAEIGSVEAAQGIDAGAVNSKGNAGVEAAAAADEGKVADAEKRGTNVTSDNRSDRSSNTRVSSTFCSSTCPVIVRYNF